MRYALVLVGLFGCGGGHGAADAPGACKADLESAIDRTCTTATDCVLVSSADCCGTIVLAIAAASEPGFASAEATYIACLDCPPLGCQHADEAEDGKVPGAGEAIIATCDANRCKSIVSATPSCAASGGCAYGPSCNGACCNRGERCSTGTCMCDTHPACGNGDTCESAGPTGGDLCGSFCCGVSPCPQ